MRALLSVYDKTGVVEFARELVASGWEIISTGGTLRELQNAGVPATSVSDVTGFPEILEGRVKTLHPAIHGGLLGRPGLPQDADQLAEHGITPIDLLAVNLYPFEATISRPGVTDEEAIEQIDIGGPAMLRAAAKNHQYVMTVVDPEDYNEVLTRVKQGSADLEFRRKLAAKVFEHTSRYDAAVGAYLLQREADEQFPEHLLISAHRSQTLRYGENPHQRAAAYRRQNRGTDVGVLGAVQLQGKELSFNNLLDADAAWRCVVGVPDPCVAIIKHTIPCGLAEADTLEEAYIEALAGDPVSAFGGIVASNTPIDGGTAARIAELFYEVVLAPDFSDDAQHTLSRRKQLRLLTVPSSNKDADELDIKTVSGGWLIQEQDSGAVDDSVWEVVTERKPAEDELVGLRFAWRAVRHVKSNAIVLAQKRAIVGVGSGQPNRVESVAIAVRKAGSRSTGSVMASDAFFPFPDGVQTAANAGVTAVIQPGGSVRDAEVIDAANNAGMAMIFTHRRHFKH